MSWLAEERIRKTTSKFAEAKKVAIRLRVEKGSYPF